VHVALVGRGDVHRAEGEDAPADLLEDGEEVGDQFLGLRRSVGVARGASLSQPLPFARQHHLVDEGPHSLGNLSRLG